MGRGKERPPRTEISTELLRAFGQVFLNRTDVYPLQQPKGHYSAVRKPLTTPLVLGHLKGHITIGAYALSVDSRAKWICFDADDDPQWAVLLQLAKQLEAQSVLPYRERSRRGGHLWLFFPTAVPGGLARRFGRQLLAEQDVNENSIELYPKQDEHHTGAKAVGSFVRLPLGVHRKSGMRYPFVDAQGQYFASPLEQQLRLLASPTSIPFPFLMDVLARAPQPKPMQPTAPLRAAQEATGATLSERIKNAVSVLEFVSHYVDLDRNHKGFCPFHDDQHMSFQVDPTRNFWHCYAGCRGQTVIDFRMRWRSAHGQDGSFTATIKDLATLLSL
jgi:hypothetical protein